MQVDAAREQPLVMQLWASLEYIRYSRTLPGLPLSVGSHGVSPVWRNVSARRMVRAAMKMAGTCKALILSSLHRICAPILHNGAGAGAAADDPLIATTASGRIYATPAPSAGHRSVEGPRRTTLRVGTLPSHKG